MGTTFFFPLSVSETQTTDLNYMSGFGRLTLSLLRAEEFNVKQDQFPVVWSVAALDWERWFQSPSRKDYIQVKNTICNSFASLHNSLDILQVMEIIFREILDLC